MPSAPPFCLALPYEPNRWLLRAGESLQLVVGCWLRQRRHVMYTLSSNSTQAPEHSHMECWRYRESYTSDQQTHQSGEEIEILASKRRTKHSAFCLLLKLHTLTAEAGCLINLGQTPKCSKGKISLFSQSQESLSNHAPEWTNAE